MYNVINQIIQLGMMTGNNQINYLNEIKTDLLKQILLYTYDPHKKYKIEEGKYDKIVVDIAEQNSLTIQDWQDFVKMLDMLATVKSANDELVREVKQFISKFKEGNFLKKVLFKDLRLNMGIKKFQKVWNDFCTENQVQLAGKFAGKTFESNYYSRKLDGLRTYILDGKAYSRSNKLHSIKPLEHILKQLEALDLSDYVLDGELIYLNNDMEDFQKAISLARSEDRTIECDNLYFVVFDIIKKNDFLNKQVSFDFEHEYKLLKMIFEIKEEQLSWYKTAFNNILLIKQVKDDRLEEMQNARKKYNWEGLMLRNGKACYECKRTNNLLKIKAMQDTELPLVDMEEGTGRHAGRLGAFVVDFRGNRVRVGSGFSDEQRVKYWNNKEQYIGKNVKVQYFEETKNQDGTYSLRFPVFLSFRDEEMEEFI